jgi:ferredoxin
MPSHSPHPRVRVNPAACTGHGLCAELLPELITLDEWGYPLLDGAPVPAALTRQARRAVRDCPALALMFSDSGDHGDSGDHRGSGDHRDSRGHR